MKLQLSHTIGLLLIQLSQNAIAQEQKLMVYNYNQNQLDSLYVEYDSTTVSASTDYNIGTFDSEIEELEEDFPTQNTFPNSQFTTKRRAADDFNITSFPIRTSVKIFYIQNDSLMDLCSGSVVSEEHILTAAHCALNFDENEVSYDSLYVCPIFNNGVMNNQFECSHVEKVYFFDQWNGLTEDLALLELEVPLGRKTGWLGIGFNEVENYHSNNIYYKFSYPSAPIFQLDPNEYNGDTLYYNYGKIDIVFPYQLGVMNAFAIPGESGSSLIRVKENEVYRSYGVLSYSNNIRHARFNNWKYYAFESIINNPTVSTSNQNILETKIYPNPTVGTFEIGNLELDALKDLRIYDNLGRNVVFSRNDHSLDVSNLSNGIYNLVIHFNDNKVTTHRIIKCAP